MDRELVIREKAGANFYNAQSLVDTRSALTGMIKISNQNRGTLIKEYPWNMKNHKKSPNGLDWAIN